MLSVQDPDIWPDISKSGADFPPPWKSTLHALWTWAGYLAGYFNLRARLSGWGGLSAPTKGRIIRSQWLQRPYFERAIKSPLLPPWAVASLTLTLPLFTLWSLPFLPNPSMILVPFWGKRERRSRSTFPPINILSKWGEHSRSWSWSSLWISWVLPLLFPQ